ncbi:hypothetical protein GCM10025777_57370 [Membranihabitans marinus]
MACQQQDSNHFLTIGDYEIQGLILKDSSKNEFEEQFYFTYGEAEETIASMNNWTIPTIEDLDKILAIVFENENIDVKNDAIYYEKGDIFCDAFELPELKNRKTYIWIQGSIISSKQKIPLRRVILVQPNNNVYITGTPMEWEGKKFDPEAALLLVRKKQQ